MAGWRIVDTESGRAAFYGAHIGGLIIQASVREWGGDSVEWSVRENDEEIAGGIFFPTDGMSSEDENWAWNKAKLMAEDAICYPIGMPRIMWPEKKNEIIANYLLSKCDEVIKIYEEKILNAINSELSGI